MRKTQTVYTAKGDLFTKCRRCGEKILAGQSYTAHRYRSAACERIIREVQHSLCERRRPEPVELPDDIESPDIFDGRDPNDQPTSREIAGAGGRETQ